MARPDTSARPDMARPGTSARPDMARPDNARPDNARPGQKTLRQCLESLLAAPSDDVEGLSNREALAAALFKKAFDGDVRAAAVIRDTLGEKPVDAVKIDLSARLADMSLEEKETEARRMAAELGLS